MVIVKSELSLITWYCGYKHQGSWCRLLHPPKEERLDTAAYGSELKQQHKDQCSHKIQN